MGRKAILEKRLQRLQAKKQKIKRKSVSVTGCGRSKKYQRTVRGRKRGNRRNRRRNQSD